jgi:competence protein ComEC
MRAGIMSLFTIVAWYAGRKFEPWRILLLVAALTLMLQPMFLINLGWLLSFASFVGIMILGPKITSFFYGDKTPGFVGSTIITTLAATLMTLPITLYYYGPVSLISVVANLLILPTLPFAMGLVFASGIVSGAPFVEMLVGFLTTKILDFHIAVVEFFGEMRSFVVEIKPYEPLVFLLYILVLAPIGVGLLRRKMVKLREVRNNNLE